MLAARTAVRCNCCCAQVFDKDGNGFISAAYVLHVRPNLRVNLPDAEVDAMTRDAVLYGDARINHTDVGQVVVVENFVLQTLYRGETHRDIV